MSLDKVRCEIETAMALPKCQKCGCMAYVLTFLTEMLPKLNPDDASDLQALLATASQKMQPLQYDCLGCQYCHPAVAHTALQELDTDAESDV